MSKEVLKDMDLDTVTGGKINCSIEPGDNVGTLTASKVGGSYHFKRDSYDAIRAIILTGGMTEAERIQKMKDQGLIY